LSDCPFKYQGQYEDEETGLYYNRFRYYDPSIGAYLSQDPIGLAGGNRFYEYSFNTNLIIDPLGLCSGEGYTHVTYRGVKGGKSYTGYAGAPSIMHLTPDEIVKRRYSGNFDDFGGTPPIVAYSGEGVKGKQTARGLEQHYYKQDVDAGIATANKQNPVGDRNPHQDIYRDKAGEHLKTKGGGH
jgi:RHS repeat-associated protein